MSSQKERMKYKVLFRWLILYLCPMQNEQPEEIIENDALYEHVNIVVDKGQLPLRIDQFLTNRLKNASRNRIQNAITAGHVLVNGKAIKANHKVKALSVITVELPEPPRDTTVYPEDIPIDIVYEDADLLIVNKEAGMVVHPGYNNYNGTLVNALAFHFDNLPCLPGNAGRPGLVHRIDKDTSGLLLISKNQTAITHLAKQFYEHSIERKYIALVWGLLPETGTISGYIGRSPKNRQIMQVYDDETKGKWSVTHYKTLESLHYVSLIECQLETGRTHQIRAHFKHIGHPLFNDALYGGDKILKGAVFSKYKQFIDNCFSLLKGQALHAKSLGFVHPKTKENTHFESELPTAFAALLDKWRKYQG